MFNRKKVFRVIVFDNIPGLFDYPKHLPLPNKDDKIIFNDKYGRVKEITHNTTDTVTEIKIHCATH